MKQLTIMALCFAFMKAGAQNVALLKDLSPDTATGSTPERFIAADGMIYFQTPGITNKLWRSDGVNLFENLNTGLLDYSDYMYHNGKLYAGAQTSNNTLGYELYQTDGTLSGTTLLRDLRPGSESSYPHFFLFKNQVFIIADTASLGNSIFKLDSNHSIVEINSAYGGSSTYLGIEGLVISGNRIILSRANDSGMPFLLGSDGTKQGTYDIESFTKQHASSSYGIHNLTDVNGSVFFSASDVGATDAGIELYVTNGTTAGTKMVKDIYPGSESSRPSNLINHKGTCYFTATTAANGSELWKATTTTANMIKDIAPGAASIYPQSLVSFGNIVLFVAQDPQFKWRLWRTDGTSAGTDTVRTDFEASLNPYAIIGNTLYFVGKNANTGAELWQTDGTYPGTFVVADINPGPGDAKINELFVNNGKLYFSAFKPGIGSELYVLSPSCSFISNIDLKRQVSQLFTFKPSVKYIHPGSSTLTYKWDFGDGTTATDSVVSHQYATSGNFNIMLIVTDQGGCSDTSRAVAIATSVGTVRNMSSQTPEIAAYPNPFHDEFRIKLNDIQVDAFALLNMLGQEIPTTMVWEQNHTVKVSTNYISPGIYYLVAGRPGANPLHLKLIKD